MPSPAAPYGPFPTPTRETRAQVWYDNVCCGDNADDEYVLEDDLRLFRGGAWSRRSAERPPRPDAVRPHLLLGFLMVRAEGVAERGSSGQLCFG